MQTYDPRDWRGSRGNDPAGPDLDPLIRLGLLVALCLLFASSYPRELVPAIWSFFLLLAALGGAVVAAVCDEPIDPPHPTHWDEAAACLALSLLLEILFPLEPLARAAAAGP